MSKSRVNKQKQQKQRKQQSKRQRGGSAWQHAVSVYGGIGEQKAMEGSNVIASKQAGGRKMRGGEIDKTAVLNLLKTNFDIRSDQNVTVDVFLNNLKEVDGHTFKISEDQTNLIVSKDNETIQISLSEVKNKLQPEENINTNANGTNTNANTNIENTNTNTNPANPSTGGKRRSSKRNGSKKSRKTRKNRSTKRRQ